jgi:hypothetical protein
MKSVATTWSHTPYDIALNSGTTLVDTKLEALGRFSEREAGSG